MCGVVCGVGVGVGGGGFGNEAKFGHSYVGKY